MLFLRGQKSKQGSFVLSNFFRKTRQNKGRYRMQRIATVNSRVHAFRILAVDQTVCNIAFLEILKLWLVFRYKILPEIRILLDNSRNNFIHLRKVVVKCCMLKATGHTSPTVYFLFRQIVVDIVWDILMANEHKVHLLFTTTYTFLCKILQQLNIADCGVTYARFKIFTKLIINNVNSVIPDLT